MFELFVGIVRGRSEEFCQCGKRKTLEFRNTSALYRAEPALAGVSVSDTSSPGILEPSIGRRRPGSSQRNRVLVLSKLLELPRREASPRRHADVMMVIEG